MRRFVPGVDSYRGEGIPESLMRFSDPGSDGSPGVDVGEVIPVDPTTLIEKYRRLCYWRQVINAENN